jgi:hypothetical protein
MDVSAMILTWLTLQHHRDRQIADKTEETS